MFNIFGFYKFTKVKSLKKNKLLLQDFLIKKNIRGTIIIAKEGLNGTISGKSKNMAEDFVRKNKKWKIGSNTRSEDKGGNFFVSIGNVSN